MSIRPFMGSILIFGLTCSVAWNQESPSTLIEPSTHVRFPLMRTYLNAPEALPMRCVGTDVRKKFIVKVYAICFYVNSEEMNKMFPEGFNATETDYAQLLKASYHRGIIMHFVRDVGKDKIADAFEEGLKKNWPEGSTYDKAMPALQAFLDASRHDIKNNQEIQIWIDDHGTITVLHGTLPSVRIQDEILAQAVTGIWLGRDPVNKGMKANMVQFLPEVTKE